MTYYPHSGTEGMMQEAAGEAIVEHNEPVQSERDADDQAQQSDFLNRLSTNIHGQGFSHHELKSRSNTTKSEPSSSTGPRRIDRRTLLIGGAGAVGGISVGWLLFGMDDEADSNDLADTDPNDPRTVVQNFADGFVRDDLDAVEETLHPDSPMREVFTEAEVTDLEMEILEMEVLDHTEEQATVEAELEIISEEMNEQNREIVVFKLRRVNDAWKIWDTD